MIETVQILTDDIDGKTRANVETVRFMLDGDHYEMELSALNRRRLTETFQPYIDHARRPSANRNGTKPATANGTRRSRAPVRVRQYTNAEVREWAKAQGIEIRDRGRIAVEIVDRYHAAQASRISR